VLIRRHPREVPRGNSLRNGLQRIPTIRRRHRNNLINKLYCSISFWR
jgi:hypothetical protein